MILQKLTSREKKILSVVIGLLILVTGYHGVLTPLSSKINEMDTEIFAMQMKLRKAKTFIRQGDAIREEAKKHPNLSQMDAGTDEEEIARLLNFIEQTARQVGVSLSDVKPEPVQSDKVSKRYSVELNAESNLDQLMEFVYSLEHSPQILKINKITTALKEEKSTALRSFLVVERVVVK